MNKTRDLTKMALLTALMCVSAYISIPVPFLPAPITALTFMGCLTAFLLSPKQTFIVMVTYVLLGAIGLPVYANGKAGFGILFGPTGGYIWSWIIAYPLLSCYKGSVPSFVGYTIKAIVITMPIIYIMGVSGLVLFANLPWDKAIMGGAVPFLVGDAIKCALAAWLGIKIHL